MGHYVVLKACRVTEYTLARSVWTLKTLRVVCHFVITTHFVFFYVSDLERIDLTEFISVALHGDLREEFLMDPFLSKYDEFGHNFKLTV